MHRTRGGPRWRRRPVWDPDGSRLPGEFVVPGLRGRDRRRRPSTRSGRSPSRDEGGPWNVLRGHVVNGGAGRFDDVHGLVGVPDHHAGMLHPYPARHLLDARGSRVVPDRLLARCRRFGPGGTLLADPFPTVHQYLRISRISEPLLDPTSRNTWSDAGTTLQKPVLVPSSQSQNGCDMIQNGRHMTKPSRTRTPFPIVDEG